MLFRTLFVFLTFALSGELYAQLFDLRVLQYGGGCDGASPSAACQAYINLVDQQIASIKNDINKDLPGGDQSRLMRGMANSSVMATKSVGKDYASYMDTFLIGAGVGAGADLEKSQIDPTSNKKSDLSGLGVAAGVVVGMNLGWMDTKSLLGMDTNRLNVYVNYMGHNLKKNLGENGKESTVEAQMMTVGFHMRYDWIQARGNRWFGWGGVKFHTGYDFNKTNLSFNTQINESVNSTSGSGPTQATITGNVTGSPKASINVATHTIPIELSTDIRLLYILSIYTGLGADYNIGSATGKGNLNANPSNIQCSSGAYCTAAGNPTAQVQASANLNSKANVDAFLYRAFAGVQINLPYVRIYGQVDKAFGNDLIGAGAGVRFAF